MWSHPQRLYSKTRGNLLCEVWHQYHPAIPEIKLCHFILYINTENFIPFLIAPRFYIFYLRCQFFKKSSTPTPTTRLVPLYIIMSQLLCIMSKFQKHSSTNKVYTHIYRCPFFITPHGICFFANWLLFLNPPKQHKSYFKIVSKSHNSAWVVWSRANRNVHWQNCGRRAAGGPCRHTVIKEQNKTPIIQWEC